MNKDNELMDNFGYELIGDLGPFSKLVGHFYKSKNGDGGLALLVKEQHLNAAQIVHGGCLMTFLDNCLGRAVVAEVGLDKRPVTVSLNTNFVAAGKMGVPIFGRARIIRKTRSLVFVEGEATQGDKIVATAAGIWKIISS